LLYNDTYIFNFRGSVPPGARFDPIHPSHPGRRGGPDPDHLPMPGRGSFSDNMFM
jgi:proteasome inhibitor subunit 1 (PI31)